jgi:hypothetical protein
VRGALVLAGGFSEAGPEGAALEARSIAAARKGGVRVIGPNTAGMSDAHSGCNLVGWPGVYAGTIGMLCQSGNVAISLLAQSHQNGHAGFTTFIGVGNEGDIQFHEYCVSSATTPTPPWWSCTPKGSRMAAPSSRSCAGRRPQARGALGRTHGHGRKGRALAFRLARRQLPCRQCGSAGGRDPG